MVYLGATEEAVKRPKKQRAGEKPAAGGESDGRVGGNYEIHESRLRSSADPHIWPGLLLPGT